MSLCINCPCLCSRHAHSLFQSGWSHTEKCAIWIIPRISGKLHRVYIAATTFSSVFLLLFHYRSRVQLAARNLHSNRIRWSWWLDEGRAIRFRSIFAVRLSASGRTHMVRSTKWNVLSRTFPCAARMRWPKEVDNSDWNKCVCEFIQPVRHGHKWWIFV